MLCEYSNLFSTYLKTYPNHAVPRMLPMRYAKSGHTVNFRSALVFSLHMIARLQSNLNLPQFNGIARGTLLRTVTICYRYADGNLYIGQYRYYR